MSRCGCQKCEQAAVMRGQAMVLFWFISISMFLRREPRPETVMHATGLVCASNQLSIPLLS